jgi:hypothetical protein
MSKIERAMVAYLRRQHEKGALSASASDIMRAVVPANDPGVREKPWYKYALVRLLRRCEINAIDAGDGTTHYFIGTKIA